MKKWIKRIIIAAILMAMVGGSLFISYYLGKGDKEIEYINLTEQQRLAAIQAARIDWISLNSCYTMVDFYLDQQPDCINWIDSIRWNLRDTLITRYKLIPRYYPVYGLQDFKPRTPIKQSIIVLPLVIKEFPRLGLGLYVGYGFSYSFNDILVHKSDYQPHQGWFNGLQLGIGLSYRVIDLRF